MRNLVPEDLHRNGRPHAAKYLERACFAAARHAVNPYGGSSVEQIVRALWSDGADITSLVLRSAQVPATTTGSGWANTLAGTAVGDFVSSLAPLSAGAKLLDAAVRVSLDGINSISFPYRSGAIDPARVSWVAEGSPKRVAQFQIGSVTLGPTHKLEISVVMTRETTENAGEVVMQTLLRENASAQLDASLFATTAGTADRPPGLLAGVSALTAATGGGDTAMTSDLSALAAAIAPVTSGLAYVMHSAQAHAIEIRRGALWPANIPIWPTNAVSVGTVIALDPAALVSGFSGTAEISSNSEALVHMEDTTPLPIGTAPNVVAAPSRSMFQTDSVVTDLILRAAWAWRVSGAVAWVQNTTW
jgi:hypothetical protein